MRGFRFVHAADLHLDSPFRGMAMLPESIRERIVDAPFQALRQLVAISLREQVDFVLLSGDIYDGETPSLRAKLAVQAALNELAAAQIQVFIVHGNHDPLNEQQTDWALPEHVHVFGTGEVTMQPAYDRNGHLAAHIYGISYGQAAETENLALKFQVQDPSAYNIALLHCNVDGDQQHELYAPCTTQQLVRAGMDYWALGHVHTRQVLHRDPYIVYPGNTQGRHVRETGPKGCYVVDVSSQGMTSAVFQRTDAVVWEQVVLSIDGIQSEQALLTQMEEVLEHQRQAGEGRPVIVRLSLAGEGLLHHQLQHVSWQEEMLDWWRQKEIQLVRDDRNAPFVWLESIRLNTSSDWQRDKLLQEESFIGEMLRTSQGMVDTGEWRSFAQHVLAPLLDHRHAGKYAKRVAEDQLLQWLEEAEKQAVRLLQKDEG